MTPRIFTYDEAQGLLPEVRRVTEAHHRRLQELREQLEQLRNPGDSPGGRHTTKLNEWMNAVITQWSEDIAALGALPKGLWTVDFDSGRGYYFCWTYDEERLSYYHRYEEGFIGRQPLTDREKNSSNLLN